MLYVVVPLIRSPWWCQVVGQVSGLSVLILLSRNGCVLSPLSYLAAHAQINLNNCFDMNREICVLWPLCRAVVNSTILS